jgi:hypothetical protein
VDVTVQKAENAVLVPTEAVKKQTDGTQVVVMRNGQASAVAVETGLEDEDSVEIRSGLQDGDEVVLSGFDKLGLQQFSSAAELPGFMKNSSPFGPGTGSNKKSGSSSGGSAKGGGAPPPP